VIKALQSLKDEYPQIAYLIVGDGPERTNLEKEVQLRKLNDQVHFLGLFPYEDVLEIYQQADLFILTSRMIVDEKITGIEGFGIVFLEANACGLPVIGSRVGGIPDAVKDGETGLLVDPENPAEIAAAIKTLMLDENLRKKLGQNGIQWAREHDWSKIVPRYVKILEEVGR
jgi:phosphatidylinositol alpha-1,6-mannosyltransferase